MGMTEREKRALADIECRLASENAQWSQQFTCDCPSHRPRSNGTLALLCLTALALLGVATVAVTALTGALVLALVLALVWAAVGVGAARALTGRRR